MFGSFNNKIQSKKFYKILKIQHLYNLKSSIIAKLILILINFKICGNHINKAKARQQQLRNAISLILLIGRCSRQ